jgi:hypothetical protein
MNGKLTIQQKAPNHYYSRVVIEGVGTFFEGYDGKTAWTDNPMAGGLREKSGTEVATAKRQAEFHRDADLFKQYETWKVLEPATVNGTAVKVLEGKDANGFTDILYFADDTGLLVRQVSSFKDDQGPKTITTDISDYRTADGIKIPCRMAGNDGAGFEFVIEITSFKHGLDLPDSTFKMPSP